MKTVDIILVKYNVPEFEKKTIRSVLKNTDEPYGLIVYQNSFKDENLSTVWNKLISKSEAEYICLLNSDLLVEKNWLKKLLEVFEREYKTDIRQREVGAVGPVTNYAGGKQGQIKKVNEYKAIETGTLSGFCLVFPKRIWQEVGGFNEIYKLYAEDSEFCYHIRQKYKLIIRQDVFIYHYGGISTKKAIKAGKDIQGILEESRKIYRKISAGNHT
ncbi:MAG: glycosyltransferase [bacterium]